MIRQVILTCLFAYNTIAAGDRLVRKMQYCLRFSSAAGGRICGQNLCQKNKIIHMKSSTTHDGSLLAVTAAFASFAQWETAMMTG